MYDTMAHDQTAANSSRSSVRCQTPWPSVSISKPDTTEDAQKAESDVDGRLDDVLDEAGEGARGGREPARDEGEGPGENPRANMCGVGGLLREAACVECGDLSGDWGRGGCGD